MNKVVNRGYVKWTDEDGVFHKEPLADHADLLASASPEEKIRAEEVRRLNAAAEEFTEEREAATESDAEDTLVALKAAPAEVLTAAQLSGEPASAAEEPAVDSSDHQSALEELRERTSD